MIEAVQWTGNPNPVLALVGPGIIMFHHDRNTQRLTIETRYSTGVEVTIQLKLNDWLTKSSANRLMPCGQSDFEFMYELVEE